jgi:phage gp46-like protein
VVLDGDIRLTPTADGGDITWTNGQPDMDQGIETAVYLSLFSGPDWWGNAIAGQYERAESALEALLSRTLTVQTMLDAEEAARQALAWMVPAGVAAKVAVSASLPALGWLALQVTVTQPAGDEVTTRYAINWAAQEVRAWQ